MIAAFLVLVHHTRVQFCCKGVTGTTRAPMGGAGTVGSAKGAPEGQRDAGAAKWTNNRSGERFHNTRRLGCGRTATVIAGLSAHG